MVEKVRVKHDGKSEDISVAGIFAYVGLEPNTAFVPQGVARDASGHLVTNATFETAVSGIYAVGAVRAGYSGLLKDAATEAKNVAESVQKRIGGN
jgi:thioredoxin reductase (NADPH)